MPESYLSIKIVVSVGTMLSMQKELGNVIPDRLILFMKPASSLRL